MSPVRPPRFTERLEAVHSQVLGTASLATGAGGFAVAAALLVSAQLGATDPLTGRRALVGILMMAISTIAYLINRAGHPRSALVGLTLAFHALILALAWSQQIGVHAAALYALAVPGVLVVYVFPGRTGLLTLAGSSLAMLGLLTASQTGLLKLAPERFPSAVGITVTTVAVFLVLGWATTQYARLTRSAVEELESSRAALEQTVIELERSAAALEAARVEAEAANAAKSAFLATMSHELRTPMNGILGLSRLLAEPGLSETERRHYVATIHDSGETLLSVLNDVLDWSKVESGKLELELAPFDPRALVESVLTLFAESARQKGLALTSEVEGLDGWVLGDATRVRQMLLNLLSNAVKFTQLGRVVVRCVRVGGGGEARLRFEVEDTGIGISESARARLFAPFQQVDQSITRRFGGTGLGLSIVRRLAELMGGDVGCRSEPGLGSVFHFEVPLPPAEPRLPSAENSLVPAAREQAPLRALVVEDNPVNRTVIEAMLRRLNVETTLVESGREALEQLAGAVAFDLVFMDCQMPELDGFETTRQFRRSELAEGRTRTPIVALTAGAYPEDRARCAEAGMDDFIAKPVRPRELLAVLDQWGARRVNSASPQS